MMAASGLGIKSFLGGKAKGEKRPTAPEEAAAEEEDAGTISPTSSKRRKVIDDSDESGDDADDAPLTQTQTQTQMEVENEEAATADEAGPPLDHSPAEPEVGSGVATFPGQLKFFTKEEMQPPHQAYVSAKDWASPPKSVAAAPKPHALLWEDPKKKRARLKREKAKAAKDAKAAQKANREPAAPKRPPSPYNLFCSEHRAEVKRRLETTNTKEIASALKELWEAAADEFKDPFVSKAADLSTEYDAAHAKWIEEHPEVAAELAAKEAAKGAAKEAKKAAKEAAKGAAKDAKKAAKDAEAELKGPKRPLSGYLLYSNENREAAKAAHPEAKITELASILGVQWKKLDEAEKATYNDQAAVLKEAYLKEKAAWDEAHPVPVVDKGPKKPLSAYLLFTLDVRSEVVAANPSMPQKEIMGLMGAKWKTLGEAEKAQYDAKASEAKAQYAKDKAAWDEAHPEEAAAAAAAAEDASRKRKKTKVKTKSPSVTADEGEDPKATKKVRLDGEEGAVKTAQKPTTSKVVKKAASKPTKALSPTGKNTKTIFDFFGGKREKKVSSPLESKAVAEAQIDATAEAMECETTQTAESSDMVEPSADAEAAQKVDEDEEGLEASTKQTPVPESSVAIASEAQPSETKAAAAPVAIAAAAPAPQPSEADTSPSDYDPAKKRYDPVDDACWGRGQDVPYQALAVTLGKIEASSGRLDKISILRSFLQSVIVLSPQDLAMCIMMCSNTLAPAFKGVELGIGDAILLKVVSETTGRDMRKLREALKSENDGDLGLIAEHSSGAQKKLSFISSKPKAPQTVASVFKKLTEVANIQGGSSQDKKCRLIKSMIAGASPVETRFIVRACSGKLRVGMAAGTVMPAVAHAIAYNDPLQEFPPAVTGRRQGESSDAFKERQEATVATIKQAFCEMPDWNKLAEVLTSYPLAELPERVYISPGTPVAPMLAKPSTGVEDILKRCDGSHFACEWKYDGERAQVHMAEDGTVEIYSRNSENNTGKYPDIVKRMPELVADGVTSFIIDCEAVAYDAEKDTILPFQQLSTRKKKDADADDLKGPQVCLYAFDLLYINGESHLKKDFEARRTLLRSKFKEQKGQLHFATSFITGDSEEIGELLDRSIKENCEGLMVKQLDTTYEIAARSHSWLKLKKDYLDGVGDTLDLTVVGAWIGKGKRSGAYGAFLLACYDPEAEEYQVITKIGTGFSDQDLADHYKSLSQVVIPSPRSYYQTTGEDEPDVWFDASQVWEVKVADLSISPKYRAAAGLVDPEKGISLRFPRFERIRDDKKPEESTSAAQVAELYLNQAVVKNATGEE
mmetsp:Transcript_36263/g.94997  ORF Transcript_36263/g.94997 Transcript_36263/m.94997 type:complete len:1311 (+) Transcript_36263:62-3994(+)